VDVPLIDYADAYSLQTRLVKAKNDGVVKPHLVLFVEHPPVFTLGKRGGKENLKVSESFLQESGIRLVQVERGGNITFHGPGQLVIYPIVNLRTEKLSVVEYVHNLEEVMIRTVAGWGIAARRDDKNRGAWVQNSKIGSVGIAVRRGVSFHGASLNVNVSLKPFQWMNPCGLTQIGVTSVERELGEAVSMARARHAARTHFMQVFKAEMEAVGLEHLQEILKSPLPHFDKGGNKAAPSFSKGGSRGF
jgi:lipoate-protein ligase B